MFGKKIRQNRLKVFSLKTFNQYTLPIVLHKTRQQVLRNLCYILSSMYEFTHVDIQTDMGRDIVASAMKQIATKTDLSMNS